MGGFIGWRVIFVDGIDQKERPTDTAGAPAVAGTPFRWSLGFGGGAVRASYHDIAVKSLASLLLLAFGRLPAADQERGRVFPHLLPCGHDPQLHHSIHLLHGLLVLCFFIFHNPLLLVCFFPLRD